MAPMSVLGAAAMEKGVLSTTSRRNILKLDKSEDPIEEQIQEACSILDIDLNFLWQGLEFDAWTSQQQEHRCDLNAPRYEWTLKWLLKKLRADNHTENACLLPEAWLLLRFLIVHVYPARVARLLTSNKYTEILRNTLDRLWKDPGDAESKPSSADASSEASSIDSDDLQEYIHSAYKQVSESTRSLHRTSKKRRRDGAEFSVNEQDTGGLEPTSTLVASILGTLRQIEYLLELQYENTNSIVTEQLKYVLRSPSEEAASVLGSGIYLLNDIGQSTCSSKTMSGEGLDGAGKWLDLVAIKSYAELFVAFWEKQAFYGGKEAEQSRCQAFTMKSLLSCLLFLDTCRRSFNQDGPLTGFAGKLESLIATNVVLPMQKSGLNGALTEAFISSPFAQTLPSSDKTQQIKTDNYLTIKLISLFFEIAIAGQAMQTPTDRRKAEPFLRRLFYKLKHCTELRLAPTSLNSLPKAYSRGIKFLLKKATDHKLQLDNSSIESIIEQATGLFQGSNDQSIEWTLISLCLDNNADVFIIPINVVSGTDSYRKPNRYLTSLLAVLDETSDTAGDSQVYGLKLERILIPLIHAFAKARDLLGFLEHWKEQLIAREKVSQRVVSDGVGKDVYRSLWEDDELLNAAQDLIEPSLSASQLDQFLTKIDSHLWELDPTNDASFSASELVILDCVLSGCHNEDLRAKLSVRARSIYRALAEASFKPFGAYRGQRWRVWRILATIDRKWPSFDNGQSSADIVHKVAHRAFAVLDESSGETAGDLVNIHREKSHAFSVVIALALFDRVPIKNTGFSSRDLLQKSVHRLLDFWDPVLFEVNDNLIGDLKLLKTPQLWTGKSADIRSFETLLLSCIMQLLAQPPTISYLNANIQQRLLRLLDRYTRREKMSTMDLSHKAVSYSSLWARLRNCEVLNEDVSFLRTLRQFQVERYLSVLDAENPIFWKVESVEYAMAFESLQDAPVLQFEPEQRIDIANRLLDVLMLKKSLGLQTVAEHLQLLAKFADTPRKFLKFKRTVGRGQENQGKKGKSEMVSGKSDQLIEKSMNVFGNVKMENDPLQERSAVLALAERISQEPYSLKILACDDALRRLTHIILGHVYATLSLDTSARYFTKFYQWIGGEIERASIATPVSTLPWTLASSMLLVTMDSLNYYQKHRDQASKALGLHINTTSSVRLQHFERVVDLLNAPQNNWEPPRDHHMLAAIVECLDGYSDLLACRPDNGDIVRRLDRKISDVEWMRNEERPEDISQKRVGSSFALRAKYCKLVINLGPSGPSYYDLFSILEAVGSASYGSEKLMMSSYFREMTQTPALETIKLACIGVDPFQEKPQYYFKALTILRATLYNRKDEDVDKLRLEASSVFHVLCRAIVATSEFRESILSLQCINILLQKQPQIISQFHIDTVLSTIALIADGLPSTQFPIQKAKVYICLCHLLATILNSHRTKLGGRYHLILPVLQSLLRPLFIPYANTTPPTEQGSAYNKTHAIAYARLLTRLSDPSPSAVGRPQNRQVATLNDETKREKSIVGQHLHYLIMTYCECQLTCELAGEGMKEALEPGLWAVLDCMGPEIMRTLNAGMNSSGRAVWKQVYEDWKKFGQWQGE